MALVRPKLADVLDTAGRLVDFDVRVSAGGNELVSKTEQSGAPEYVKAAAEAVRVEGGSGTRVTVDAIDRRVATSAEQLTADVNQKAGVGRAYFSRAEAKAALAKDPSLGAKVMKAWQICAGEAVDVDGIAERYARPFAGDDGVFRMFTSEQIAERHRDPANRSVVWLVKTAEDEVKATFVWGRNDLWAARFEIDTKTGALQIIAEH